MPGSTADSTAPVEPADRPYFAGVDLGGTNIKVGIVDDAGRTLASLQVPTRVGDGPEDATRRMGQAVGSAAETAGIDAGDIARVGLGSPGTMDIPRGMLLDPPNLPGWEQFPIRDRLAHHCGRPVSFANDAGAAAFGEYWVGSGKQFHSIVMLTLGTGVGGGIIIGDMNLQGENSAGSECGHIIIDYSDTARMCPCGKRGHLEAYCSATAVVKRTREQLEAGRDSSLRSPLADSKRLTALLIAQEAEAGDSLAEEVVLETARLLGIGAATLTYVIDPGAVILGGAMNFGGHDSPLGRKFLDRIRHEVRTRAFPVPAERIVVDFASLGSDAGYIGAAGIARVDYLKESKK